METANQSSVPRRRVYGGYVGKANPSERDRIVHLLQAYRSTENFNAHYLPKWAEASDDAGMKGGLRVIQAREGVHARLMRERLRELGETTFIEVSRERHDRDVPFFASRERSDLEKLAFLGHVFEDVDDFFKPITDLISDIKEDLQTREMLRTILDDEYATVEWFALMQRSLSERATQS
ncbi:MAG: hypothetical protein ABI633_08605 [Burkholderiales bacterium]